MKAAGVLEEPQGEGESHRTMKRLHDGLKRVRRAFDEMADLPTFQRITGQKRSEYMNFVESLLSDIEASL